MPRRSAKAKSAEISATKNRARPQSSFARLVSQERKRLEKVRDKVLAQKATIDRELERIQQDLSSIGSFLLSGGSSARSGRRTKRGERRQQVLDAIKSAARGITRGEIIKKLNAADRAAQQSISNALNALFKSKAVKREDGRYRSP